MSRAAIRGRHHDMDAAETIQNGTFRWIAQPRPVPDVSQKNLRRVQSTEACRPGRAESLSGVTRQQDIKTSLRQ